MFQPCFLAVAMTDRRRAKVRAPSRVRKPPEIFVLTFVILRSRSASLLVKGTAKSLRNRRTSCLNLFNRIRRLCPGRCGARPRDPLRRASGGRLRWTASPRRTMAL